MEQAGQQWSFLMDSLAGKGIFSYASPEGLSPTSPGWSIWHSGVWAEPSLLGRPALAPHFPGESAHPATATVAFLSLNYFQCCCSPSFGFVRGKGSQDFNLPPGATALVQVARECPSEQVLAGVQASPTLLPSATCLHLSVLPSLGAVISSLHPGCAASSGEGAWGSVPRLVGITPPP